MFDAFEKFSVQAQEEPPIYIHGLKSVNASHILPPLILLHGFPQTLHIWHRVVPHLVDKFTVILINIRGYGESSKPADIASYGKSAMARDVISVMDILGFTDSFYVCGHDRGARVAHKLCVNHPSRVRKAILLDICPTLAMFEKTDQSFATSYYHWFLMIQKEPVPEAFFSANPRATVELLMGGRPGIGLDIFEPACFEAYVENMNDPAAVHAMCNDYRASASIDMEESKDDIKHNRLIKSPLLVIWGKHGVIEKSFNALEEWRAVTDSNVPVEGYNVDSGHYIPEEAPESVVVAINTFFV